MQLIDRWHTMLDMAKYDEAWHKEDMADELAEYHEAQGFVDVWSELSDVAYTYTRAIWSGHKNIEFPLSRWQLYIGLIYMLPKYTLRWRFFRKLGHTFDRNLHLSVVRNPKKVAKLIAIAENYQLDPALFQIRAEKMLKRSFLLK